MKKTKLNKYQILNEKKEPFIVLVVPTSDFHSGNVERVKKAFPMETMVLVESRGQFFNYSQSCNAGINEANKLRPNWILLCNDDVIFKGNLEELKNQLKNNQGFDFLLPSNATKMTVVALGPIGNLILIIANLLSGRIFEMATRLRLLLASVKFGKQYASFAYYKKFHKFLIAISKKIVGDLNVCGYFMISKPEVFQNLPFDEHYLNGAEDIDFMARLYSSGYMIGQIGVEITQIGGGTFRTLMSDEARALRDMANRLLLGKNLTLWHPDDKEIVDSN